MNRDILQCGMLSICVTVQCRYNLVSYAGTIYIEEIWVQQDNMVTDIFVQSSGYRSPVLSGNETICIHAGNEAIKPLLFHFHIP